MSDFELYVWLSEHLSYGNGCYYSPLFAWLFSPFAWLDGLVGSIAWFTLTSCVLLLAMGKLWRVLPRWLWAILGACELTMVLFGNVDSLILLGVIWVFQNKDARPLAAGLLLGLLTFKPLVAVLFLYYAWQMPDASLKRFLGGFAVMLLANWGYFLFNIPLALDYVSSLLSGEAFMGQFAKDVYWFSYNWAFYPWMNVSHYYFWVMRKRIARRRARFISAVQICSLPHI